MGSVPDNIHIHEADQVIGMADRYRPQEKPDDSMNAYARLVKSGEADAAWCCVATPAAALALLSYTLRRIKGVKR